MSNKAEVQNNTPLWIPNPSFHLISHSFITRLFGIFDYFVPERETESREYGSEEQPDVKQEVWGCNHKNVSVPDNCDESTLGWVAP